MNKFILSLMKKNLYENEYINYESKLGKPTQNTWGNRHRQYIDVEFTEQQLNKSLQDAEIDEEIIIRKYVNDTFSTALQNNVNIIIASAGIDNVIKFFFKDFEKNILINHKKNYININNTKIYINAHTINFNSNTNIVQNIYPKIPKFHIEKEHLVERMNFLQEKLKQNKILIGLMIGDSEVYFKIMNDYPSDLQYFIKIAFTKPTSSEKYKNYINKNCDIILNSHDEYSFLIIKLILKKLIKIRNSVIIN